MHIYFLGIGGAGIGPLALIAQQAGYTVSGSDKRQSQYTNYLEKQGVRLHIGQDDVQIAATHEKEPIDWIVFSSAVPLENPNHPELLFAKNNNIKLSKRDEFINLILEQKNQKLIAIAGTHGKTTATAMAVWVMKQIGLPVSYSIGAKILFGDMGHFDNKSDYFIYECDEFDRNFLGFSPYASIITTIDWDHHEIYPTRNEYKEAFRQFIDKSSQVFLFDKDNDYIEQEKSAKINILDKNSPQIASISLAGLHNRMNAFAVASALSVITKTPIDKILQIIGEFPGTQRRFEKIATNIYSDYAHTPEEIVATLQMAVEINPSVVVIYEPLTNRRQYYMKDLYTQIFEPAELVYWLPTYLAREKSDQQVLSPSELINGLSTKTKAQVAELNNDLVKAISKHANEGRLVLCMAGGGGSSLDDFLRKHFAVQ